MPIDGSAFNSLRRRRRRASLPRLQYDGFVRGANVVPECLDDAQLLRDRKVMEIREVDAHCDFRLRTYNEGFYVTAVNEAVLQFE
jgi:hypothetical protein